MRYGLVALAVLAAACASARPQYDRPLPEGTVALERVTDPAEIPDFSAGWKNRDAVIRAIEQSLAWLAKPSSRSRYPYLDITHERVVRSLERLREILRSAQDGREMDARIRREFDVYRSVGYDGKGTVYFTGYYEPIFEGSLERDERFRWPLYRRPPDLVSAPDGTPLGRRLEDGTLVSWPPRAELERSGRLEGLELVWLADRFDAYIVHVQGSAKIRLRDGRILEVGYAGKTDRPYRSVGMALVRDGKIRRDELSLDRLRRYFREHPEELDRYLGVNESYVFFTEKPGGPYGSLNVPITPMATIATDKQVFPAGAAAFVVTRLGRSEWRGFALDQDTGGAIRSAGRCDIFIGTGDAAGALAGRVGAEGRLYYLFVRQ